MCKLTQFWDAVASQHPRLHMFDLKLIQVSRRLYSQYRYEGLYSPLWRHIMVYNADGSEAALSVLAHEIGHCLAEHGAMDVGPGRILQEELEAWCIAVRLITYFEPGGWTDSMQAEMHISLNDYYTFYYYL